MAQYTTATASPILKERVDPKIITAITKRDTTFSWFLKNVRKVDVSARGFYFDAETRLNQGYGSNTLTQEGGIMPRSGTPAYKKIRVDYQSHFMAGEMSGDVMDAKDDDALVAMSKNYMKGSEKSFTYFQDFYLFGNSSGSLGVVTGGISGTTVTMALAQATPYGATKIQPTQRLHFINPSNGNQRTGGGVTVSTVTDVNTSTDVVTCDAVPSDVAANDIVVIEDTYGREMQGFDFHLNDSNTNWLKDGETGSPIPKASNPWTKANVTDAAGGALSPAMLDIIGQKASVQQGDGEVMNDAVMLSHPVQKHNYRQLGYTMLTQFATVGASNRRLDLGFGEVAHNGMEWRSSVNCQADRILGLHLKNWVMPVVKLPQMYKFADGASLIQKQGTDRPYDAVQFYIYGRYNVACQNPSEEWLIKNIAFSAALVRQNRY